MQCIVLAAYVLLKIASAAIRHTCPPKMGHTPLQEQPLLVHNGEPNDEQRHESEEHRNLQGRIRFAMISSLIANVLLLVAKIVAFILSQSKSVLASAADSFVDIASQVTNLSLDLYLLSSGRPEFVCLAWQVKGSTACYTVTDHKIRRHSSPMAAHNHLHTCYCPHPC